MPGDEHVIRSHEQTFHDLKEAVKDLNEKVYKNSRDIVAVEASAASAHKRLLNRDEELKLLNRLVVGLEHLGEDVKELIKTVNSHGDDIGALKTAPIQQLVTAVEKNTTDIEALRMAPGNKALEYWQAVIMVLITGAASIFLTLALTGKIGG